jgi:hypothetical protein
MDKTTELKARLRSAYLRHREDLADVETALECNVIGPGNADHAAADALDALAYDEEIDLLCKSLKLPKVVEVHGPNEYQPGKEWLVEFPNGHSFKHSARSEFTLLTILVPVVDEWIAHLNVEDDPKVAAARTIHRELPPKQRRQDLAILRAISELSASPGTVANKDPIRERLASMGVPISANDEFTNCVARLKDGGLIDSKTGARGGYWLTDAGTKWLAENNPTIPSIPIDPV